MKKVFLFLIFGIFLISLVSSQTQINYYVYGNKVLVKYYFSDVSNLELRVPYDVDNLSLNVNSDYEFQKFESHNLIKVDSAKNLTISYVTKSMIDNAKKGNYFTSKNFLNESSNVKLVLPESAVLVEDGLVFPEPDSITSDGRSVIFEWENYSSGQIVINYEYSKDYAHLGYILFFIFIFVFIISFLFPRKYLLKKMFKIKARGDKNSNLTRNLLEDEKRIVEYLLSKENNEAWTKEILRDLKISKVKLSRKIRSLEQKELIKKIPYGNANKIRILEK